jgi:hypothetical protein
MHDVINKLVSIQKEIQKKNHQIKIIAVSKTFPIEKIMPLINFGHKDFGENKVQEAAEKWTSIKQEFTDIKLHMIGKIQTNKVKQALKVFDVIQSLDREKLIKEISKNYSELMRTKKFYLQINIGKEDQKSGVHPEQTKRLYDYAIEKGLNITGLMCIPPNGKEPGVYFRKMVELKNTINSNLLLSMGMSGDYLSALQHQTNCIRIGSLLFNDE